MPSSEYKFGDRVESIAASERNPNKYGFFVRRGYNSAVVNRGSFIEITDGKGKFWRTEPDNVRLAQQHKHPSETA
jgi:hypothetical protein